MPYRTPSPPQPVRPERDPYVDPLGLLLRVTIGLCTTVIVVYVWAAGVLLVMRVLSALGSVLTP